MIEIKHNTLKLRNQDSLAFESVPGLVLGVDQAGGMDKSIYDADGDGVVDNAKNAVNAENLGGRSSSEYYGNYNPPPYPVISVNGKVGAVDTGFTYPQPNDTYTDPTTGEEQFTGNYWFDGKPIYRRVATGYIGVAKQDTMFQVIPRIEMLIKMHGFIWTDNSTIQIPINQYWESASTQWYAMAYVKNRSDGNSEILANVSKVGNIYVVVEYTKPN